MNKRKTNRWIPLAGLIGSLFALAVGIWVIHSNPSSQNSVAVKSHSGTQVSQTTLRGAQQRKPFGSKPIEEIRVGDRVLAHNPQVSEAERSSWKQPDWQTWVKLTLLMPKPDGSELKIEMLRSEEWVLNQLGYVVEKTQNTNSASKRVNPVAHVGTSPKRKGVVTTNDNKTSNSTYQPPQIPLSAVRPVFRQIALASALINLAGRDSGIELLGLTIQLDLHELALTGEAIVVDIEPCPAIRDGDGQVVTATFLHSSGDVIDLVVGNEIEKGGHETIGTTSNHPFWSVDRQDFVQAGSLRKGEYLRTIQSGIKCVVNKLPRPGPTPVFNLEVFGEHTYFVGKDGVLVHNDYDVLDNLAAQKPSVFRTPLNKAESVIAELGLDNSLRLPLVEFFQNAKPKDLALGLNMGLLRNWAERRGFSTIGDFRRLMPNELLNLTQGQQIRVVMEHVDEIRFNTLLRGRREGELLDISRAVGLDDHGNFLGSFTDYEIFLLKNNPKLRKKLLDGYNPFKN